MKYLLILFLMACAGGSAPSPAVSAHERECRDAVAELRALREAGVMSCAEGKAKVAQDFPGCQLAFTCGDGGAQ